MRFHSMYVPNWKVYTLGQGLEDPEYKVRAALKFAE